MDTWFAQCKSPYLQGFSFLDDSVIGTLLSKEKLGDEAGL